MMSKVARQRQLKSVTDEIFALSGSELTDFRNEEGYVPVVGEGASDANIVFIGEAPGKNEAITGRPFCGRAGKILDELLDSIDVVREEVYITNIVKDRPPQNRDPSQEEIALYAPFLDRELEILEPKAIATLGRFSMEYIIKKFGLFDELEPISKAHGKEYEATTSYGTVMIIPLYHPAATIYNRSLVEVAKEDFEILKRYAKKTRKAKNGMGS
jgi:DNA polymerase